MQVTNTGSDERFCEDCVSIPPNIKIHSFPLLQDMKPFNGGSSSATVETTQNHNTTHSSCGGLQDILYDPNACAGCREQLKEGQALIALDRQWHISCFR